MVWRGHGDPAGAPDAPRASPWRRMDEQVVGAAGMKRRRVVRPLQHPCSSGSEQFRMSETQTTDGVSPSPTLVSNFSQPEGGADALGLLQACTYSALARLG